MNDSFVLFASYIDTVKWMSHAEAGVLFKMILNYESGLDADTDIEDFDEFGEAYIAFTFIKRQLDKTDQKYNDALEKQREAGKKGAEKRWGSKDKNSNPIGSDGNPISGDRVECHYEYDNDIKERVSKDTPKKAKRFSPPTREDVEAYCRERKNNVNADRFIDFYASKGWMVGKNPMKDWKAAVRTWEQREKGDSGYTGLRFYVTEDDSS
jgi:hypothetical protein